MAMTDSKPETVIAEIGRKARRAAESLVQCATVQKNRALTEAGAAIRSASGHILQANAADLERARARGISGAMLDRLKLDEARLEGIAAGLEKVADLPDPVGRELARWRRPNGLDIARLAVPIGVVGVIYRSEEHTSELQSLRRSSYAVFCLKKTNSRSNPGVWCWSRARPDTGRPPLLR